jgi:glutamate/tyrosine decarboxylase-like PLP-dependent enzyme
VFRKSLERALSHSLAHLETLESRPVTPRIDLATLRERLGRPLEESGVPPELVIDDLVRDIEGGIMGTACGRFFGWVIGGALPAALAADWLTSAWDQNATLYMAAPAAGVVEEVAGAWLKELLGLPAHASFAFVTGCQMAHVTCMAAARHAVLAKVGWDVEVRGLCAAPAVRIIATQERHGSFERAVRLVGLGTGNIEYVSGAAALETALARGLGPAIVLLQAGDVNTGAFDDFTAMVPVAHRHGAWVHVDGAFGLWAAASPRYSHLVRGVRDADSWATDGHKWLNVPYDSGYAFVADPEAHRAAMSYSAGYLPIDGAGRDQIDWTPEFSRRARGFATYAALRQLGRAGVNDLVDRCCWAAREIVAGIGQLEGAEVLAEPIVNQGLVRFGDDRRTDEVIAAIQADGEAFFGGTTWRGMRAMRVSVSNWQTDEEDVHRTIASVARVLRLSA